MKLLLWSDIHWSNSNLIKSYKRISSFLRLLQKENFDALILAGDIGMTHVKEIKVFLTVLRKFLPNTKIYWVLGNHDLAGDYTWQYSNNLAKYAPPKFPKAHLTLEEINTYIKDLELEFNIFHLYTDPLKTEDTIIVGFDGWYNKIHPGARVFTNQNPGGEFRETTDRSRLPPTTKGIDSMSYLKDKAAEEVNELLNLNLVNYKHKVLVTHFPPYTRNYKYRDMIADENLLPLICEKYSYLLVGHSHQDEEWNFKGCNIINCGNDYEKCQAKLIDLATSQVKTIKG
jgi:predicted phosphodiesterase